MTNIPFYVWDSERRSVHVIEAMSHLVAAEQYALKVHAPINVAFRVVRCEDVTTLSAEIRPSF